MKKVLISVIISVITGIFLSAQNYAPVNSTVKKRFYKDNDPAQDDYFFFADSVDNMGPLTRFYQYYAHQFLSTPINSGNPLNCDYWWGSGGHYVLDTTWLGTQFTYNSSTREFILYNDQSDTLYFDFSIGMNDSSLFYQQDEDQYFIKHTNDGFETVLDSSDSIKTYTILHYDTAGIVVNSPLHGYDIKIGKNLGLVSFMNTYEFPFNEERLVLRGQVLPPIGNYQMQYEELYPWQPGDVLQMKGSYYYFYNFPSTSFFASHNYRTMTITNRIETPSTVTIFYTVDSFTVHTYPFNYTPPITVYNITYPNPIVFLKNYDILVKPYNKADISEFPYYPVFSGESLYIDSCDTNYQISSSEDFVSYCETCGCYGNVDGYTTFINTKTQTKGLGITFAKTQEYGYDYGIANLIYYKIGGQECGDNQFIGVEENHSLPVSIYPNPAQDQIFVNYEFDGVKIYDLQGELVQQEDLRSNRINVSSLKTGMYFAELRIGAYTVIRKLIKA